MCSVVNIWDSAYDVFIGRPSIWGNPYHVSLGRDKCIALYREYVWAQIYSNKISIPMLLSLDGLRLGCFCKPQACHGDVIREAVAWAKTMRNTICLHEIR